MKFYVLFFIFPLFSAAQQEPFKLCDSVFVKKWELQYYSFEAKYPVSSEVLVREVNKVVNYHPKSIDGFVTIRFVVNCKGQAGQHETYQTDSQYQTTTFEQKYIDQLLSFVKSLKGWKLADYEGRKFDYYSYFTFKINHGKITEIVP